MATTIKSSALDFNNIKSNLKDYLANKDEFRDYNFEASGLSNILDVLAYNTHLNALIANFALNESYLPTAQLRSSVVSLSEGIGYVPDTDTAAQAKVRLTFNSSAAGREETVSLPAYTKFTTSVDDTSYSFQTVQPFEAIDDGTGFYEFKTNDGSNRISIFEGSLRTKTFLVGEYQDNPVYVIPDTTIDADTVTVKVYASGVSSDFTQYQNISGATSISANSTIYILKESPNGYFDLSFGDGETFGIAPTTGSRIEISYLSVKGATANGASDFTPASQFSQGNISADLNVVTYVNSIGGDNKESIESIRKNAPFQYATQNRMVTAGDYSSLILQSYSTLIEDIASWGGEEAVNPEFGAVYISILFENGVTADTISTTKQAIRNLAAQLSIVSFNIRFIDPIETFIETDTFFQFNPKLTDLTLNAVQNNVNNIIAGYFTDNTGGFKQAFRRSNVLTEVDASSPAILSSRSNIRMQQRFTPTSPNLILVINSLLIAPAARSVLIGNRVESSFDTIVNNVVEGRYEDAANLMIQLDISNENFAYIVDTLKAVAVNKSVNLQFPVPIAIPDDNEYIITSNAFTYQGTTCLLRNKLSTNIIQIVASAGDDILVDNIGNFNAVDGIVTINNFNPTSISAGLNLIKLAAVPSNQSAIAPTRNEILNFDKDRSTTTAVTVSAIN
jgi:hypothetical protein